jgi:hypothetical protein
MKPVYLGAVRGQQSAFYRPGQGWTDGESQRLVGHRPTLYTRGRFSHACPVTVARRKGPGLVTKVIIIVVLAAMAAMLAIVLSGGAGL